MASTSKNTYSIDDILNEYSVDNKSPEKPEPKEITEDIDVSVEEISEPVSEDDNNKIGQVSKTNIFTIPKEKNFSSNNSTDTEFSDETDNDELSEENDFPNLKSSTDFSYRSATRIQDKPNKILKNPDIE